MAKPIVEATAKQGRILRVDVPFDEAVTVLRQVGCRYPISVKDLALARMEKGKSHSLSQNGSYIREGVLYFQDAQPILALNSPLLDLGLAKQAVQANREGRYFSTQDGKMYEKFAKLAEQGKNQEPEKRKAFYLPKANCTLTKEDADFNNILRSLFKGEKAVDNYLEFNGQGIPLYVVDPSTVKAQKGTLLTQLWFRDLDSGSGLDGSGYLYDDDGVRGVLRDSERATASEVKPTKMPYTPSQLTQMSKLIQGVRAGNLPASRLEKVAEFLGRLKQ